MSDHTNFIDTALVRCFNRGYIHPHLRWLQDCVDFTNNHGFQSHNVAVQHCVMDLDPKAVAMSSMDNCHEAIEEMDPEGVHFNKLNLFITASAESLHKHFARWLSPKLLPAALLSDLPMAKVVASIVLKTDMPTAAALEPEAQCEVGSQTVVFHSDAHRRRINVSNFNGFLWQRIDEAAEHAPADQQAADALLQGLNLRDKDYSNAHGNIRMQMHQKCSALPSQTQIRRQWCKGCQECILNRPI